jgi:AcrR family transcriptional regulator
MGRGLTPSVRHQRRRAAIVDAAARVFNSRGLRGATLADIATEVELDLTSLRHYFHRKDDLVRACFERSFDVHDELVRTAGRQPGHEAGIRTLVSSFVAFRLQVRTGARADVLGFGELGSVDGDGAPALRQRLAGLFRTIRGMLQPEDAERSSYPAYSALAHGVLSQLLLLPRWLALYDLSEYPRVEARFADILLNGIAASGRSLPCPETRSYPAPADADQRTRTDFLKAAVLLINTHGYHGASVDAIAARLKVTKGSFYHHLSGKDGLLRECVEHTLAAFSSAQKAAATGCGGLEQALAAAGDLVAAQHADGAPVLRMHSLTGLPPEVDLILEQGRMAVLYRFSDMLSDGVIDGSVRPCDTRIASQMVCQAIAAADGLEEWAPAHRGCAAVSGYLHPLFLGLRRTLEAYRLHPPGFPG